MSFYIPTILQFQDGFLFLEFSELLDEAGNSSPQLIWTDGNQLLFSFEPVFRQLVLPQFSTYPALKVVAVEPATRFRRTSAIAISDFCLWLQNTTNITFDTFQLMIEGYLNSRNIDIQPSDYPLWMQKLQQQLPSTSFSPAIALAQLQNLQFERSSF